MYSVEQILMLIEEYEKEIDQCLFEIKMISNQSDDRQFMIDEINFLDEQIQKYQDYIYHLENQLFELVSDEDE